jgi:hypothetical protein
LNSFQAYSEKCFQSKHLQLAAKPVFSLLRDSAPIGFGTQVAIENKPARDFFLYQNGSLMR